MSQLIDEYNAVKDAEFELEFQYPSLADLDQLQLIHRDISPLEAKQLQNQQLSLLALLEALETGKVFQEDLGEDVLLRLRRLIEREDT
jgi:superfamily I DNA and RNA helicase